MLIMSMLFNYLPAPGCFIDSYAVLIWSMSHINFSDSFYGCKTDSKHKIAIIMQSLYIEFI